MTSAVGYEALGHNRGLFYYKRKPSGQVLAVRFHSSKSVKALVPDAPTRGQKYLATMDRLYRAAETAGIYSRDWEHWHDMPNSMQELPEAIVYRQGETLGRRARA